eukprot:CAMPEP_0185273296 /NCGR_PEP_ID=MMETSP1359-20130426/49199_1 /TAXON_ID=552665 /ORGANISM="Bigelowiella longifila, Strain CCMP242" /LENGTH=328 /DNA_ID=CAMNT_0027865869 /DNA_START=1 /DNA_END=987 /DNA_ORIENTATION=-
MKDQKIEHAKEMLWHASCSTLRRMLSDMDADTKASLGSAYHDSGDTYITAAVKDDDAERVFVLSQHFDVHSTDIEGQTPLHHACIKGNSDLVYFFLKTEFGNESLNKASRRGFTPLMEAAQMGETDWVALMLSRGAKPSVTCNVGKLAANYAAARGHWGTVAELVSGTNVGLQLESADQHWRTVITFYNHLCLGPQGKKYHKVVQEFLTEGVSTLQKHRRLAFERHMDITLTDSEAFRIVLEYTYPCFLPPTTMEELGGMSLQYTLFGEAVRPYCNNGRNQHQASASHQDSSQRYKRRRIGLDQAMLNAGWAAGLLHVGSRNSVGNND